MKTGKLLGSLFTTSLSFYLSAQNQQPNIVFILADDLGWTDLSCTGSDFYETPHIDQLRNSGMLFTRAYTNAANSAPSRASLLTGLYTPRHGVYTVSPPDRGKPENRKLIPLPNKTVLDTNHVTFPEILRANGYRTIHIGKWHLGSDEDNTGPLANGFDVNIAGTHIGTPYSYYFPFCGNNGKCLPNLAVSDSSHLYLTDRLTEEAINQIKQSKTQPFFLYMAHYAVHTPLQAKKEKVEKYRQKPAGNHHRNATYAAMIESLDESVGRIIETLRQENKLENTLVVFFSDNGGMLSRISDNWPLRGGKGMPYEGGNRVPLIVSFPNHIAQNSTSDIPVMGTDWFATLLDFANITYRKSTDGQSLKNMLLQKNSNTISKRNLYFYFPAYLESYDNETTFRATPYASIISDEWKLIYFFEKNEAELYNLKNDVAEIVDRSQSNQKQASEMHKQLFQWMRQVNAPVDFQENPRYLNTNLFHMQTKLKIWTMSFAACGALQAQQKPNIIYILADDLGYGDLGCYGQTKIETPHIDQLAREGLRFTQHYSGSPVSAPSRCVLLTGKHSGHAYIRGNDEMGERGDVWSHEAMLADSTLEGQRPLPTGTVTLPKLLKKAGYMTAMVGKWGLGYPGSEGTPNKMGFDFFYGYNCQRQAHTYYPPFLYRNEHREYLQNKLLPPHTLLDEGADPMLASSYDQYTQQTYAPDLMWKEIGSFIEENKKQPFFLMWTTPVPHVPLQAPRKWIDYYVKKFGDEAPCSGKSGYFPARYPRAAYAAMISYLDEQIGELITELKRQGLYENTLILFTSDNGPSFNGGSDSPWFDSAHPFKSEQGWGKTSLREGGIRVPMIATWQGKIKAGTTSDHISAFWDVMPTFVEIAGERATETDGISFLPALLGKKQKKHDYLYWEFPENEGCKAIRMGKWKGYIGDIKKGNRSMELYNLETDPCEQQNMAATYPDIVKTLYRKMKEAHREPEIKRFNME